MNRDETVLHSLEQGVLQLQLNRPAKKNAITRAMYAALAAALDRADHDPAVRVVLLGGTDGCFTAGNDLEEFRRVAEGELPHAANPFLPALGRFGKPVVAAVSGVAVGIGTTLLLHCDLVCAAPSARFQLPFVRLGLCPEFGSSHLLPLLAGYQRAAELVLLGRPFDAEEAQRLGLVNRLCPEDELADTARRLALELAALPPAAVRLCKSLLKRGQAAAVEGAMAEELVQFGNRLRSDEAREAFAAFAERRPADFSRFS